MAKPAPKAANTCGSVTMKPRGGNGRTIWTPERKADAFTRICTEIALGKSLRKICEAADMPDLSTARGWINNSDELAKQYARAREEQAEFYADQIIEIADTATDANLARVQIDARKWVASKLKSKTYGDKVAHVGGDENDNPIRYTDEAEAFTRRIAGIAPRIAKGQP